MLLELIFNDNLNNITHARTDARTHKIPSSRAPVGAKNNLSCSDLMEGDLALEADHDDKPRHGEDRVHAELLQRGSRHRSAGAENRILSQESLQSRVTLSLLSLR